MDEGSSVSILSKRISCIDQCLKHFAETTAATTRTLPVARSTTTNLFQSSKSSSLAEITLTYAPISLEKQFQDFYRLLHAALVPTENTSRASRSNASAFVQGTRGSGKTLLLNQVLAAISDEIQQTQRCPMFRIVHVNGLLVPGHSVHTVVREILQQLSEVALQERANKRSKMVDENDNTTDHMGKLLKLKQTSFANQLQLLTEIIQLACVDGIPILFVLDELDTFLGGGNRGLATGFMHQDRQLLLYHLLERVATQGSFCSLVGLTSDSAIMMRLEKRIKSRAEGTAKFFLTGPCRTYQDLTNVLCSQILKGNDDDITSDAQRLKQELSEILSASNSTEDRVQQRVQETLFRDYRLGKDMRWFTRVMYHALSLYRYDLVEKSTQTPENASNLSAVVQAFHSRYLEEALIDMGGSFVKDNISAASNLAEQESDQRIQALRDLPGPQVALVLVARRILHRDSSSSRNQNEAALQHQQLTLSRMLHEYQSSYKGQSASYSSRVLRNAFTELMEVGLFRPAADHTGTGPFQYQHRDDSLYSYNNMDVVERMPLHLTLDIHREVKPAIENNILNCSTALREWGRKTN